MTVLSPIFVSGRLGGTLKRTPSVVTITGAGIVNFTADTLPPDILLDILLRKIND
jgi:hypothetical protein